jgi:hypothetical protein
MDANKTVTANFYLKSIPPPEVQRAAKTKPKPEQQEGKQRNLSIGGGLFYAGDLAGGLQWDGGAGILAMPYHSGGAYIFFDAKYLSISIGGSQSVGKWETPNNVNPDYLPNTSRTSAVVGAAIKYPNLISADIYAGDAECKLTFYPIIGFDYDFPTYAALEFNNNAYVFDGGDGRYNADALSALWVKFGGGIDAYLTERLFIRAELLYGARTPNTFESEKAGAYGADMTRLGQGITFRAGAGFKL